MMANDTDTLWSNWMAAAQDGDTRAYHALMRALQPWLRGFFARRAPAVWLDDLVQETLLAVHSRRHTYDPNQPFLPWLRAIARYKWIDRLRYQVKVAEVELRDDIAAAPVWDLGPLAGHMVRQLLLNLSPGQAAAIRAVKLEGHSVTEAARLTGQNPSLVKVNIHRGLRKLIQIIERSDTP